MSEAAGSGASRYVVQSGDSLIDIAQASYGDGALWYVIADANGITAEPGDPLPTTEVGKAYEIPDVVRSSQSASTFKPYEMAEIIGNDRPIAIPPPPPPKYSDIEADGRRRRIDHHPGRRDHRLVGAGRAGAGERTASARV